MTRKSKPLLAFSDLGLWWAGTVPTIAGVSELSSSSELGVGASIITMGFFPCIAELCDLPCKQISNLL